MELDRPSPATEPLPAASLPLKAVQEEPSGITEAHHLAAVAQPIPAPKNPETAKANGSDAVVGSAEAKAAATLGLLTSVANHQNQQQQQQQSQQSQSNQPSFTPINQPQPSPGGSPGPQLGPCPTTPNPLPPGYNKDQPICANCSTQTTPLWRRSHDSTHILCNACALFFKMKGRPRPISLKTDVIKSRNRSKGKSTSKDRAGTIKSANKNDRSESHSRSRESDVVGKKSAPGGADEEDDEMGRSRSFGDATLDGDSAGRKARKTGPTYGVPLAYGGGVPGAYPYPYGYPHPPHPHAHAPYPPASIRARSRSSDPSARGVSVDGRRAADGAATPPTGSAGASPSPGVGPYGYPPGGYHPGAPGAHPEGAAAGYPGYPGYPPYYGAPGAYGGHPGQPGYYPPPPSGPYGPGGHPIPTLAHLHAPTAAHAQSNSRANSPAPAEQTPRSGRSSASASPPHPSTHPAACGSPAVAQHWPHPNPNIHLHQPHTHSPLGGARPPAVPTSMSRGSSAAPPLSSERGGVTLAPIASPVTDAAGPNGAAASSARPHLPSIGSVGTVRTESPAGTAIPRHTSLFEPRYAAESNPSSHVNTPTDTPPSAAAAAETGRPRGVSVSSNSPSISSSEGGIRSPEVSHRQPQMPWGKTSGTWTPDDERRGRPERRFDDGPLPKGKGREIDEIDELDEDIDAAKPSLLAASHPSSSRVRGEDHRRMVGVETGLNELRMGDHHHHNHHLASSAAASASSGMDESSRSRSGARERGRSRGPGMAGHRSQSTSRARGVVAGAGPGARSTSSGRRTIAELEAENARLRTKNAELTFLNGLMQSRLGQLEGPGRVPTAPMTGLSGADEDESYADGASGEDDVAMDHQEESVTPVSAHNAAEENAELAKLTEDPHLRTRLLEFLRGQGAGAAAR